MDEDDALAAYFAATQPERPKLSPFALAITLAIMLGVLYFWLK